MKERDILFSAPMVRAILEGRKTVPRRLVKPSPGLQSTWLDHDKIQLVPHGEMIGGGWQMHQPLAGTKQPYGLVEHDSPLGWVKSPFGDPGDRLWVRETWFDDFGGEDRPSLFMPRAASRITLEVVGVRVERLHEITDSDVAAEGTPRIKNDADGYPCPSCPLGIGDPLPPGEAGCTDCFNTGVAPRAYFSKLWDSIYAERAPWASNPWVWRVEFRKVAT